MPYNIIIVEIVPLIIKNMIVPQPSFFQKDLSNLNFMTLFIGIKIKGNSF